MSCPCGAMPTHASCMRCLEDFPLGAAPVRPERRGGPVITAGFDGTCAGCDDPIVAGTSIVVSDQGRWHHAGCLP